MISWIFRQTDALNPCADADAMYCATWGYVMVMQRTGAPSDPASLRGRQCSMCSPGRSASRLSPSTAITPCDRTSPCITASSWTRTASRHSGAYPGAARHSCESFMLQCESQRVASISLRPRARSQCCSNMRRVLGIGTNAALLYQYPHRQSPTITRKHARRSRYPRERERERRILPRSSHNRDDEANAN